jgi:hypothetical protein
VNKGVPSLFVAMMAGVGMGLFLSRMLSQTVVVLAAAPVPPQLPLPSNHGDRLRRFLDVERN